MLDIYNKQSGFTLIELMIGVVIIAILFSLGAPNLMAWLQNAQIRTAAESLSTGLQLARAEAVRRNTNIYFQIPGINNVDSSWTVGCVNPPIDPLTGMPAKDSNGVENCPGVIHSHSGSEGTSNAQISANIANVTFNGLGRANNQMTITVVNLTGGQCQSNNGPMRCLSIMVVTGGQIRMCNPAYAYATNPQGC
jgi:type IV fimbrial biogenesis protein FimT